MQSCLELISINMGFYKLEVQLIIWITNAINSDIILSLSKLFFFHLEHKCGVHRISLTASFSSSLSSRSRALYILEYSLQVLVFM